MQHSTTLVSPGTASGNEIVNRGGSAGRGEVGVAAAVFDGDRAVVDDPAVDDGPTADVDVVSDASVVEELVTDGGAEAPSPEPHAITARPNAATSA